jgi:ribosomal protein L30/L7E
MAFYTEEITLCFTSTQTVTLKTIKLYYLNNTVFFEETTAV